MKLVINRSKWLHGEGSQYSALLRARDQKMCCLGFYALALGFEPKHIANCRISPSGGNYAGLWPEWLTDLRVQHTANTVNHDRGQLVRANDSTLLPDAHREALIKEIFAKHDVEVEFIDGEET